ncbi:MAG TPA: ABC transporter permease [Bryobacteraceae bacterium]|nr:ABC transporter permease [Bryobacteraceae bacterium]
MGDLRSAIRGLRKSPGLATIAVLSLALGIGVNVTVFSVVREMILDDLSARDPQQLVRLENANVSYTLYRDLGAQGIFPGLAFYRGLGDRNWRRGGHSEIAWTFTTSANFFDVLGVAASRGRLYSAADEGREYAVLSYAFWKRRLQEDADALGKPIELNGRSYMVAGVLPPDYRSVYGHGVSPEVYLSDPGNSSPSDRVYALIGRQGAGQPREQTRQRLAAAIDQALGRDPSRQIVLRPMSGIGAHAAKNGDEGRFLLFFAMLFAVAGILLLIACSNVAGLLLARAVDRRREIAIRKALGADRLQLLRPLFAEGLVLALGGAALALLIDFALRSALSQVRWPSAYGIPFAFHFQGDRGLLGYGAVAVFAALLLSSLIPAWRGADADLSLAIKQTEPAFLIRRFDLRRAFVMLQVSLSVVLLTLGGLFARSLVHLVSAGPGFDVTHTLIAAVDSRPEKNAIDRSWYLRQQAVQRVETVPGVLSVTSTGILPLMGELPATAIRRADSPSSLLFTTAAIGAGEHYFRTLQIPILEGRDIEITDRGRRPIPVVINRTLAHALFADRDPLGRFLVRGEDQLEVAGVAADSRMRTLGEGDQPAMYLPDFNGQLLVRVAGNPQDWMEPLRQALGDLDPAAALEVRPLADASAGALFPLRVATGFVGSFSVLGVMLVLIGLYGSVSYAVGRRTHEFGIRAALGATSGNIMRTAAWDTVAVMICGMLGGVGLAVLAIRPITELLPAGIDPWAPVWLLGGMLPLLATGLVASWIPARRAAAVLPSVALRQ